MSGSEGAAGPAFPPSTPIFPLSQGSVNNLVAVCVMLPASIISMMMRLGIRFSLRQKIILADYLCLLSLVLFCGYCSATLYAIYGVGMFRAFEPDAILTPMEMEDIMKTTFTLEIMFAFIITSVKLSILAFYHTIFSVRPSTARLIYITGATCIVWFIIMTFLVAFQCNPPSDLWKTFGTGPRCMDIERLLFGYELSNFFLDVAILCIPVLPVIGLNLPLLKKISAAIIFLLGAFVCITSVLRILTIWDPAHPDDPMDFPNAMLWSTIQLGSAIVCACLPTLGPMIVGSSKLFTWVSTWYGSLSSSRSGRSKPSYGDPMDTGNNSSNGTPWIMLQDEERTFKSHVQANSSPDHGSQSTPSTPSQGIKVSRQVDVV
jgi:hypothetical protein